MAQYSAYLEHNEERVQKVKKSDIVRTTEKKT